MRNFHLKEFRQESRENTLKEAEVSIARYCAYQERTVLQVKGKLELMGIGSEDAKHIINKMISEDFINEQRFAIAYTLGKLNQNKWGRKKISYMLYEKGLNYTMIENAFANFGEDKYIDLIKNLVRRKWRELKDTPVYIKKNKIARFLIAKGFESELIWNIINREFSGKK
jgi:regulatory protein